MVFDPNLSEKVSLPIVLDELLYSNEKPDVVMSFLEDCGDSLGDVLSGSLCSSKIPNLDFFRKITKNSGKKLFRRIIEDFLVGSQESWMFVVQLSKTGKDAVRNETGMDPQKICQEASLRGPVPKIVDGNCLDAVFLEKNSNVFYAAEKVNSSKDGEFGNFLDLCPMFLFEGRICQEDFFSSLSDSKKYLFLERTFPKWFWPLPSSARIQAKFAVQLLCGSDRAVGKEMFGKFLRSETLGRTVLSNAFPWFGEADEVAILKAKSFQELYMDYAISGIEGYVRPILVFLMMKGMFRMLKEFVENEPELVERYLPIGDFLEIVREERES